MISKQVYSINWASLIMMLLPPFLRRTKMVLWLEALSAPAISLHAKNQIFREQLRYKLQHNGQVIYLEKVLNEFLNVAGYDPTDHEATKIIYIGSGEQLIPNYIYINPEQQPIDLYTESENEPLYLLTDIEYSEYSSFTIMIPIAQPYNEAQIRALVDYYIDTRLYTIKTY